MSGRRIKIRYMTQVKARPPHFALFGNQLDALPKSYTRYLVNGLREAFDLPGVPIRISLRTGKNPYRQGRRPEGLAGGDAAGGDRKASQVSDPTQDLGDQLL